MMKYKLLLAVCILLLCSCSQVDSIKWSNNITNSYNQIKIDLTDYEDLISIETIGDSTANQAISSKAEQMLLNIGQIKEELLSSSIPVEGEAYQEASIKTFECIENQINAGLGFLGLTENSLETNIEEYAIAYDIASKKTVDHIDNLRTIQEEFLRQVETTEAAQDI